MLKRDACREYYYHQVVRARACIVDIAAGCACCHSELELDDAKNTTLTCLPDHNPMMTSQHSLPLKKRVCAQSEESEEREKREELHRWLCALCEKRPVEFYTSYLTQQPQDALPVRKQAAWSHWQEARTETWIQHLATRSPDAYSPCSTLAEIVQRNQELLDRDAAFLALDARLAQQQRASQTEVDVQYLEHLLGL